MTRAAPLILCAVVACIALPAVAWAADADPVGGAIGGAIAGGGVAAARELIAYFQGREDAARLRELERRVDTVERATAVAEEQRGSLRERLDEVRRALERVADRIETLLRGPHA